MSEQTPQVLQDSRRFQQDPHETAFIQNPYELYANLHAIDERLAATEGSAGSAAGVPVARSTSADRPLADRAGPAYWEDYGFWCLTRFEGVNAALRDRRLARLPPSGSPPPPMAEHLQDFAATEVASLLALEPPEHTRLRRLVNRAFLSRQVDRLAPGIEALANQCIDTLMEQPDVRTFEFLTGYATPIPVTIIARLLGVPETDCNDLLRWSHDMVKVYTLTQTHADEVAANNAALAFTQRLQSLIDSKRQVRGDDLLSELIQMEPSDGQPLSDMEIISIAILLLNAGHEATVHQLGNAVYTVLQKYDNPASLFTTPEQADATVNELMRFDAPLHLFTRYAQTDVPLGHGIVLKRGETLGLLLGAANRDPHRFANPDSFLPSRDDPGHLALGAGIHFCVGAQLARLELRISLTTLFQRLPSLTLIQQPHYQDRYHFHGLDALNLRW